MNNVFLEQQNVQIHKFVISLRFIQFLEKLLKLFS